MIKRRMRAAGVTQEELARRLRCTDRQVRNLLARPERMRLEDANVIADALELTDEEWVKMTRKRR